MIYNGIGNEGDLLLITQSREYALQKRVGPLLPSQDTNLSRIKNAKVDFEPEIRWEKGTFIDIYA
jgi:hypothetical protein